MSLLLPLPRPTACVFCAFCLLPWRLPAFLPAAVREYVSLSLRHSLLFRLLLRFFFHLKQGMLISLFVRRGHRVYHYSSLSSQRFDSISPPIFVELILFL